MRELGLTKSVIQQRANQLIRELHSTEETEEALRMLQERRNRSAAKMQGFDKSLAECHTNKNSSSKTSSTHKSSGKNKNKSAGTIQTGLRAFFTSTKSVPKKQKTVVLSDDEGATSSSESVSTGKRKEIASSDEDSPSGKKAKNIGTPVKVVPGKRRADSPVLGPTTPEKKLLTVVNADGVIELVSVRKK